VELINKILGIVEIAGRLPRIIGQRIVLPVNLVKETTATEL
jgi:hypothetical protein